ncbi:MAG: hypothetical protein H6567_10050 [Lewinellaceae bacterium]|nr:hypothetical protein [Lewinellaceae bacterium]
MKRYCLLFILTSVPLLIYTQSFYKTPYGEKYHLSTCKLVENTSAKISLDKAKKMGLAPCKICKPQAHNGKQKKGYKEKGESKIKHRCLGKTKKGKRCKNTTKIANSYCFQHHPK